MRPICVGRGQIIFPVSTGALLFASVGLARLCTFDGFFTTCGDMRFVFIEFFVNIYSRRLFITLRYTLFR